MSTFLCLFCFRVRIPKYDCNINSTRKSYFNIYPHRISRESPLILYTSLSQSFYLGGTLEIIFRFQGTPA
jgi:hypothetical protein